MVTKEATGYTDASPICGNAFSPYGYPGNGCIKVIPPEEVIQDPYHQRLKGEEGPVGCCGNPWVVISFYLISLSHSPSVPLLFSYCFLCPCLTFNVRKKSVLLTSVCGLVCNLMQAEASFIS